MNSPRTKPIVAVMAIGILALAAMAMAVEAKPGDQQSKQDRKDAAEAHKEQAKQMKDAAKQKCASAADNSTLAQRCEHLKQAVKARRGAHALLEAIRAHEQQLGRVEYQISQVEKSIANNTFPGNHTKADAEARLLKLNERHDKLIEKIEAEHAKLQKLHDKWAEVRDNIRDRKEKGQEDGGVTDDGSEPADASSDTSSTSSPPA